MTKTLVAVLIAVVGAAVPASSAAAKATSVNCGRLPTLGNSYQTQAGAIAATGISCSQARGMMHIVLDQVYGYTLPGQVHTRASIRWVKTKQVTGPRFEDPFLRVTLTHGRQSVVTNLTA